MEKSIVEITEKLRMHVANKRSFGKKAKIVITGLGAILLDATGEHIEVTNQDITADVTLTMNIDTLQRMQKKEINGMEAFFQGLLSVEGDQGIAMELGDILEAE